MLPGLKIVRAAKSHLGSFDVDKVAFGDCFSDHMFSMTYDGGRWGNPEITPYGPVLVEPAAIAIQYAQTVFEGLKVYRGADGVLRMFRPDRNAARLKASCERLCIPPLPADTFIEAISALVRVDEAWVPSRFGYSLYVRPIVTAMDGYIGVRPSRHYRFFIVTCPVGMYFREGGKGLQLKVEEKLTRAPAEGGLGAAKAAANYAASLLAGATAIKEGFDQVLWLDGTHHRFVEEAGLMNVFFALNGRVLTAPLGDSILPGVTRESVIALLRDRGMPVDERPVAIDEVAAAAQRGELDEMFASGTAAVVTPIGRLSWRGQDVRARSAVPGPLAKSLYDELTGIQFARLPDRRGWTRPIEMNVAAAVGA
jgi:branched-chain amino acid aminotransferase